MSNREIKFRAFWLNEMYFDVQDASFYEVLNKAKKGELTVMQYTGLKDKHNKEIYEGDVCIIDIFKPKGKIIVEVVFIEGCFFFKDANTKNDLTALHYYWEKPERVEIIGNIFNVTFKRKT